ncbi:hypothetical protein GCM10009771_16900 [Nesterenkonia flava]|uniref:DUF1874 domain-containing protein n=2 Tax=Nesterenkonia flava TaxID=469799 RepID=A0ABU1FV33_9MICC|nr:DUF1874 domain-containing protein [Nesterenkonia flava]
MSNYPVVVFNTGILTDFGSYDFVELTLDEARDLVRQPEGFVSAVGHQSSADVLTEILGVEVPENRAFYTQKTGQVALVFRLKKRPPEGVVLDAESIKEVGFTFGKLTKLS